MIEKYKPAIIFFCVIAIIMILFPPIYEGGEYNSDEGYSFIFNIRFDYMLNVSKLLIQLFMVFLCSILFYFMYARFKYFKQAFTFFYIIVIAMVLFPPVQDYSFLGYDFILLMKAHDVELDLSMLSLQIFGAALLTIPFYFIYKRYKNKKDSMEN
ncbi:MAG: hypothetical protein A2315_02705 [Ignavibacteria bacterium RIFOXYB2_FULL_35_12]|nr:MAG: hypothetical protein A2058_06585 [Ignavibacteria bacterium GWA2_36_19]OGU50201.1 MAG: hypothetical protein A2006_06815 [Ignavibacteria bacterium GWC2_35_8]OGU56203.1 MAG: hypothetical protein A2X60_06830 [Ignavibacteria bacterium GWF2_35_20]OGU83399.1 MAG: hypothetical protein A2254_14000 [Ignavibacteria bacterium RIFOXYA2_FULL_35_9]OGU86715.1 MAG: hypothetical protein A2492_02880 [Ignavibacteria bacterium RIFOXYC12_FULL_35_11]OGU89410.1 MAG: hypothetical protein A3K31_14620 [Ignavibac